MYITARIHTYTMCQVHIYYELFMSVYIVCEQSRHHQPVVRACSDYLVRVVFALFHMLVFLKFKLSCTVLQNTSLCRSFTALINCNTE